MLYKIISFLNKNVHSQIKQILYSWPQSSFGKTMLRQSSFEYYIIIIALHRNVQSQIKNPLLMASIQFWKINFETIQCLIQEMLYNISLLFNTNVQSQIKNPLLMASIQFWKINFGKSILNKENPIRKKTRLNTKSFTAQSKNNQSL